MRKIISAIALLGLVGACASDPPAPNYQSPVTYAPAPVPVARNEMRVPLTASGGGTPMVKVAIDGICCASFIIDSGASDVSVSPVLFVAMEKGGHISKADLIDVVKYRTANGVTEGLRFRMPPMTVGGHTVYGVIGSVSVSSNSLLLGQSFLKKFRSWTIDNDSSELVLGL